MNNVLEFKARDGTDAFAVLCYRDRNVVVPPAGWIYELVCLIDEGTISNKSADKVLDYWYEWFWEHLKENAP